MRWQVSFLSAKLAKINETGNYKKHHFMQCIIGHTYWMSLWYKISVKIWMFEFKVKFKWHDFILQDYFVQ